MLQRAQGAGEETCCLWSGRGEPGQELDRISSIDGLQVGLAKTDLSQAPDNIYAWSSRREVGAEHDPVS